MNELEKMNEAKYCFNELVDKGWEPFGIDGVIFGEFEGNMISLWYDGSFVMKSLNDLCSIDSGLWAFVVEQGLYEVPAHQNFYCGWYEENESNLAYKADEYMYRLMLSSIQEDKAKFILENITLEE